MSEKQEDSASPEPSPGPVAYIGPNVSRFGLQRFQVFSGGLPEAATDPVLVRLFVPVSGLSAARIALESEGSPEWSAYRDAAAAFSKRGA